MTASAVPLAPSPPLPWVRGLGAHGARTALYISGDPSGDPSGGTSEGASVGVITYADLARRVDELAARLAGPRRLVQVEGRSTVDTVVGYLAAQAAGHVILLVAPGDPAARLRETYRPDVVLDPAGGVEIVRETSAHRLHPDLALLLSTSGSTGSAKLVRLSAGNLAANAAQIATALGVRPDDCAALTLPITYCYGLSVLHTHLAAGASLLLTDLSVVDDCFWRAFRTAGATTFPGVPHTFELLERSGFAERDLPSLRYVTQAGGRMEPERIRRFAELGRSRGWDLHVMYGQSEATARMTCLPPDLAAEHPDTVGVPVPGATVDVVDGEIVFRGPNVMLGYAGEPADLALGRTVEELRTGDLGELTPDGLVRVVGRRARFVKVLGHRIDLDALEFRLRAEGHDVRTTGRDGLVVVASGVAAAPARESLRRTAIHACGVPREALRVVLVRDQPMLASGKPDYPALLALACPAPVEEAVAGAEKTGGSAVATLYGRLLARDVGDDATFVSLGGDSLSYVEVSIRLEELLGQLPPNWHVTPVRDLELLVREGRGRGRRRGPAGLGARTPGVSGPPTERPEARTTWRTMETSVWLRALAIVCIVGTHAGVFLLQGTANALLVIAGYQVARFQLADPGRRRRVRRVLGAAVRIAVPSLAVIVGAHLLFGSYETRNLVLANWIFGEQQLGPPWRFWFIEAMIVALLVVAAVNASSRVAALDRRHPFGLPLALTAAAFVLFRLPILPLPIPRMQGSAPVVLYLFLLGWTLARVATPAQKRLMTVLVIAMIGTFSFNPARDGLTIACVLLMLWWPVSRVPAAVVPVVQVLAAASLYIYVIHWQALDLLWGHPLAAFAGSLALGLAYWWVWTRPVTAAWGAITRGVSRRMSARSAPRASHRVLLRR